MKINNIFYYSRFSHALKRLPKVIQNKVILKEKIFRQNSFDARLNTHKLKGDLIPYWSFSIDYSTRILFEFQKDGSVVFIDVGTHSVYK